MKQGEALLVSAEIEAETRAGHYPQVHAVLKGSQADLPEIWIQAHTNYRNGGGGNNLSSVGVTMVLARSLASLVGKGVLPQPLRSIRFIWGAEHMAVMSYFYTYPERIDRVLAFFTLDIVGESQRQSILRLYRTPNSRPSFLNDIVQEAFEVVAEGNMISVRDGRAGNIASRYRLPVLDPDGSKDPFFHRVEPFWGPSDHEDVLEASIGLHAVLLNSWPDPYMGTHADTSEHADATQMKRAAVITGASAWLMATAGPDDIPALIQNALEKARVRLAREEGRAMSVLRRASGPEASASRWQALNIITEAYRIEGEALASLDVFGAGGPEELRLDRAVAALTSGKSGAHQRLLDEATSIADAQGWDEVNSVVPPAGRAAKLIPRRTPLVRGPVNIFRHQYGQEWLKFVLEDSEYIEKISIAKRNLYAGYEVLNFVDGSLSIAEIRDRLAAEYGPVPIAEIHQYLVLLERAGVISFNRSD